MIEVNWLDFVILIFASFSINNLILNRLHSEKLEEAYWLRWVLYITISLVTVLLRYYISPSILFLQVFAIAGWVEILTNILNLKKEKILSVDEGDYNKLNEAIADLKSYFDTKTPKDKAANKVDERKSTQPTKIMDSNRMYNRQEFLKESKSGNIVLSNFLRTRLEKPNLKNK